MVDFDLAIFKAAELVKQNLIDNKEEIKAGYKNLDENCTLNISMPLKIRPADNGIEIESHVNFIESKIKCKISAVVSDQLELPTEEDAE